MVNYKNRDGEDEKWECAGFSEAIGGHGGSLAECAISSDHHGCCCSCDECCDC